MTRDFESKDIIYVLVFIVIMVCFVTMVMEKVEICYGLLCFMGSLTIGLFYLLFFDNN